jgi:hypothetical protein
MSLSAAPGWISFESRIFFVAAAVVRDVFAAYDDLILAFGIAPTNRFEVLVSAMDVPTTARMVPRRAGLATE